MVDFLCFFIIFIFLFIMGFFFEIVNEVFCEIFEVIVVGFVVEEEMFCVVDFSSEFGMVVVLFCEEGVIEVF